MPGDKKHHTDKFRRCVEQVMNKGHEESSAYAICTTSLQNAGEPVFEAAEETEEEVRTLESGEARTLHLLGATGAVRREELAGKKYLVVPVVALMEGVIHAVNADTPEFVSGEVLRRAASSWIGKPVTLGHPAKAGKQCSASDAVIRKDSGIGVIWKSEYLEDGKKLYQEAWVEEEKAKKLHPALYESLSAGGREEVSVGAMVVTNAVGGDYRGKKYKGAWLETSGDHLAFLPGGRGACSCEMGCGTHRAAAHRVTDDGLEPEVAQSFLTLEGKSLDERISMVQQAVDKWNAATGAGAVEVARPPTYAYARQVFDDRVIISVGDKTFSVPYSVKDGEVKFEGEPTEVRQAWVALAVNSEPPKNEPSRIKNEGGKFVLYSKNGQRRLAEHLSRKAAEEHLSRIDQILAAG